MTEAWSLDPKGGIISVDEDETRPLHERLHAKLWKNAWPKLFSFYRTSTTNLDWSKYANKATWLEWVLGLEQHVTLPKVDLEEIDKQREALEKALSERPTDWPYQIKSAEKYIPWLNGLLFAYSRNEKFLNVPPVTWQSTMTISRKLSLMEGGFTKPMSTVKSPWFESVYVHFAIAAGYYNTAEEIIRAGPDAFKDGFASTKWASLDPDIPPTTPTPASPATQGNKPTTNGPDAVLLKAADFLRLSSGIFFYIAEEILPNWINPDKNIPPECTKECLLALADVALADAQQLLILRTHLLRPQTSLALIGKLFSQCQIWYTSAVRLLEAMPVQQKDELDGDFFYYVRDGVEYFKGKVAGCLAEEACEAESRMGLAYAYSRIQQQLLSKISRERGSRGGPMVDRVKMESPIVEGLLTEYKRMNDSITFESVPDDKNVRDNVEAVPPRILAEKRSWAPPLTAGFGTSTGSGGVVA